MKESEKIEVLRLALERIVNWPDLPDCYTPGEMQKVALEGLEAVKMITLKEFEEVLIEEVKEFVANWETEENKEIYPEELESVGEWMEHFLMFFDRPKEI